MVMVITNGDNNGEMVMMGNGDCDGDGGCNSGDGNDP